MCFTVNKHNCKSSLPLNHATHNDTCLLKYGKCQSERYKFFVWALLTCVCILVGRYYAINCFVLMDEERPVDTFYVKINVFPCYVR